MPTPLLPEDLNFPDLEFFFFSTMPFTLGTPDVKANFQELPKTTGRTNLLFHQKHDPDPQAQHPIHLQQQRQHPRWPPADLG